MLLIVVDAGASPVETASIRTEDDGVSGCMSVVIQPYMYVLWILLNVCVAHFFFFVRNTSMCTIRVSPI